jgi:pilus assembly protein CpaB
MRKLNIAVALGVALAVIGAGVTFAYGRSVDSRIAGGKRTKTVLVTTRQLEAGTTVADLGTGVERRAVPAAYVARGALASLDSVAALALLGPVPSGGQLTRAHFGKAADVGRLEPTKGNVALAVGVDLVPGVARYISAPGLVDLFVTYPETNDAKPSSSRTKLFASGIKVLSVSVAPGTSDEDEDEAGTGSGRSADQVIAVLDVAPTDAERIVNSSTLGKLYLGLNGTGQQHSTPGGATPDDVVRANS